MYRVDNCTKLVGAPCPESTALYNTKRGVIIMTCCDCPRENGCCQCSSVPAQYNFQIVKGSNFDVEIVYKDASKKPVNLTGYEVRLVAQYKTFVFNINAKICDAENGRIHLWMTGYETSSIYTIDYRYTNRTQYSYQMELITPSKRTNRILEGTIDVIPCAGGCIS